jgi:microsomal dipeptidase-like Zn-dependent dipeptidase
VPIHDHLTNGYDESAIRRLVRTNWLRTIGWSVRALLVLLLLMTRA